jgi:hypothetical protein
MEDAIVLLVNQKNFLLQEQHNMKHTILHITQKLHIINNFLSKNCNHTWITDDIDISPDHSKQIIYCSKCELTQK